MSTTLALAQARLASASEALEAAIVAAGIRRCARRAVIDLGGGRWREVFSPSSLPVSGPEWRAVEARIELEPHGDLAKAYATYRRAERAAAKAQREAYLAQMTPVLPASPKPAPRRKNALRKTTFAAYLAEARAA